MPGPRTLPARSSQRRNTLLEEPPMRTRSTRGPKSGAKLEKPETTSPKSASKDGAPLTRKATRAASNISNYAHLDSAEDVYASYEKPLFMVFGLTAEFFDSLEERELTRPFKKARQTSRADLPALGTLFDRSDEDDEDDATTTSEESDGPVHSQPAPRGRGRGGGRGSRGGRGRGGRSRGSRGGRGRGSSTQATSPLRTRPSRNAAPMFSLTEEDDEDPSNQNSPTPDAKESPESDEEATSVDDQSVLEDGVKNEEDDVMEHVHMGRSSSTSTTPPGSPPPELVKAYSDPLEKIPVPLVVPKISLTKDSASETPKAESSTPAESVAPPMLDPEDDVLTEADLPDPWIENAPPPVEDECDDRADFLLKTRFKPMTDVGAIIASLTKFPFSQRSTENLYALAENTQFILKAWQDEYLKLDARTAPHAHPPKKPCNGGRIPINHKTFEDMKEADLYGYTYDARKAPGMQDPFTQRPGHEKSNGRELRQRRARDMLDSAAPSEEEEEDEEGRPAKRQRRATRRFDGSDQGPGTGANTPKKNNGWGGARKKGVSKYAQPTASQTPEPEGRGKRGKAAANALLHQRIQAMREESAVTSSGDEGSSNVNSVDNDDYQVPSHKRGRPLGSKNTGRRSDYGVKKGPRKRVHEDDGPNPPAHTPNPPAALQSLSDGQIQFAVDPPIGANLAPAVTGPHSTETVFQATPQPPGASETSSHARSIKAQTPETYMNTTPLSQYGSAYMDESGGNSGSGSRKKPRVKSEKRSQSMTIWWAERKARQKELGEKSGTPAKSSLSRSSSSTGRRGGRTSTGTSTSKPAPETQRRPSTSHAVPAPPNSVGQDSFPGQFPPPPPPFSAASPTSSYSPIAYPPPQPVMMPSTHLAAVPPAPAPPPPQSTTIAPAPAAPQGPGSARALAPAPLPPQIPQAYPSPYGPRTAPRPKSNGPPPLAPAPAPAPPPAPPHISPYPPLAQGQQQRDMPFKVMVPGPPPGDQRRGSR